MAHLTTRPADPQSEVSRPNATQSQAVAAVRLLFRVEHQMHLRIERLLRPLRLSFAGYEILMCLWLRSGASPSVGEMGDMLQVHPTSVSSTLDRLADCGYVVRVRDAHDARVVRPRLAANGLRAVEVATAMLSREVFTDLRITTDEVNVLLRVLRSMRVNAGDFRGTPPAPPA